MDCEVFISAVETAAQRARLTERVRIRHLVFAAGSYRETARSPRCKHCEMTFDSNAPDPRIGRSVSGRWRIESLKGRGAFARVYRARALDDGGAVAVKYLDEKVAHAAEPVARFQREVTVLATLTHPAIVRVLASGYDDGLPYLVMEYVDGITLQSALLSAGGVFSLERSARVMDLLLEVLAAVHAHGIAHRDLKPENIMLLAPGQTNESLKVVDFGLAHVTESDGARLTMQGAIRGTPHYMSPEQCAGGRIDTRADIYAAGCVLMTLLTGGPPYDGNTGPEVMVQHAMSPPPRLVDRVPDFASMPSLERLVASALSKRPTERPDATQFRHALRAAFPELSDSDAPRSTTAATVPSFRPTMLWDPMRADRRE
jgi:serine/threonine-protein kinase